MSVCEKASCWQTSLTLASQRDLVTYSAAICAVGRGRHWDQALLLLDHMAERLLRAQRRVPHGRARVASLHGAIGH